MIFISKGTVNILTKTFTEDASGCSIVIGEIDSETMKVKEPLTAFFADWNAAGWLGEVYKKMQPTREDNLPPLRDIVQNSMDGPFCGNALCDSCVMEKCDNCIVKEWEKEEPE